MSGIDVLTFLVGSYAFGKTLSGVIGYKQPPIIEIPPIDYPVVDDLVNFLIILALVAVSALILHPCFKVCHGRGRWRDTLLGLALVTGLIVPIVSILQAVVWKFIGPDALKNVNFEGGTTIYSIPVFAAMHQMTPKKTALVLIFGPLVTILTVGGLVFIVLMLAEVAFSDSLTSI